jgi:hypothetical protein
MSDLSQWRKRIDAIDMTRVPALSWIRAMRHARKLGLHNIYWDDFMQVSTANPQNALKIKSLVQEGASWNKFQDLVWQDYHTSPGAQAAAKMVELVIISGTVHDCVDVLSKLNSEGVEYYFLLSRKIRESLCVHLWRHNKTETLSLFLEDAFQELLPIEKLYLLSKTPISESVFILQKDEETLLKALENYAGRVKIDRDEIIYNHAREAKKLGLAEVSRRWLKAISPSSSYYSRSLPLLMEGTEENSIIKQFESLPHWKEKLEVLEILFKDSSQKMFLQSILVDLKKHFPLLPACLRSLSQMLIKNYQTDYAMSYFKEEIVRFREPPLAAAIWQPLRELEHDPHPLAQYWFGVALVQLTLVEDPTPSLFKARSAILFADQNWSMPLERSWPDLYSQLLKEVSRSKHIREDKRNQLLAVMKVVAKSAHPEEIEIYLQHHNPSREDLYQMLQDMKQSKHPQVEVSVLRKISLLSHLRNEDLAALYRLSSHLHHYDLSWRLLTIIDKREVLNNTFDASLAVSGERRSHYPFLQPNRKHLALLRAGLSGKEQRLFNSLLLLGTKINELMVVRSGSKQRSHLKSQTEIQIEKVLNHCDWVDSSYKDYLFFQDHTQTSTIPSFISIFPENPWTQVMAQLFSRLGGSAIRFSLRVFKQNLEAVLPRQQSAPWLRSLTPEQRIAWSDLLSMQMNDEECYVFFMKVATRLSTMIYPAHNIALTSLIKMRVPFAMIKDYENFLVSQEYCNYREISGLAIKIPPSAVLQASDPIKKI